MCVSRLHEKVNYCSSFASYIVRWQQVLTLSHNFKLFLIFSLSFICVKRTLISVQEERGTAKYSQVAHSTQEAAPCFYGSATTYITSNF
jgi:hypothetical protein